MFAEYVQAALRHAKYEVLEDDTYMATVEGFRGVIAVGDTIEECRDDLIGVIEGWVALGLRLGHTIPTIDGHNNTHQGKDIGVRLLAQVLKESVVERRDWLQAA